MSGRKYPVPSLFMNGQSVAGRGAKEELVIDPSNEDVLGSYRSAAPEDLQELLDSAAIGFEKWRRISAYERCQILHKVAATLRENAQEIGALLTLETGKILSESITEVRGAADHFDWSGEEGRRLYGYTVPARRAESRLRVELEPLGIVLALIPWNFPLGTSARKVAPALAAGCSVILRPPEEAPATVEAFVRCCQEAGLPPGVLNMVLGSPKDVVEPLMASFSVRAVTFTGSTRVGKILIQQAADTVKHLVLELGGHAPAIVLPDVDPRKVGVAAARAKFRNAGQVCVSPSRFIVHEKIVEPFTQAMVEETRSIALGSGFDAGAQMGPLTTARQRERVERLVEDARSKGARILAGGQRPAGFNRGYFFEPTVLGDVPDTALIFEEEPFGPVAPIIPVRSVQESVEKANAVKWGLAGYLFTSSLADATKVSEAMQVGMVGLNTFAAAAPEAPFGGVKESGYGRECGLEGIREFVSSKLIHTDIG